MPRLTAKERDDLAKMEKAHGDLAVRIERQRKLSKGMGDDLEKQTREGGMVRGDGSDKEEREHAEIRANQLEITSLKRKVRDFEAKGQRPGDRAMGDRGDGCSRGHYSPARTQKIMTKFWDSRAFKEFQELVGTGVRTMGSVPVPGVFGESVGRAPGGETRDYDATTMPVAQYLDTGKLVEPRKKMPILRRIISEIMDLPSENRLKGVEFDEEVAEYNHWTLVAAAASSGASTIDVKNAQTFSNAPKFNEFQIKGKAKVYTISLVVLNADGSGTLTFAPTLDDNETTSSVVVSTNPMYFTAEGRPGSQSQYTYQVKQWPAAKVMTMAKTTIERLTAKTWVERTLRKNFPRDLRRREDHLSFYAPSGVSGKPTGLMNDARIAITTRSTLGAGKTALDALLTMISACHDRQYDPDAGLVNYTSMLDMALEKGSDRQYVLAQVFLAGMPMLWEVPIIATNVLQDSDSIVGEFNYSVELHAETNDEILIGTSDKQFDNDERTFLQRYYFALPITHPNGLQRGNLAAV